MLLCHCRVVSDRTVRAVIDACAVDTAAVTALCGAGGECGGCVPEMERLLADAALGVREPARLRERQSRRRTPNATPVFAPVS